ncbi:M56 family metallopeptidase [Frateuria soli]|uniref:M56 family metallopeptidase n=1 Tax=Frateuria soli TaxID=1542730 RepID=UPI001E42D600|nr:M56 family metallopeptidase [Frateuria soli]UGB38970.1 M56 family metallopeptidase [Frateuria soli]
MNAETDWSTCGWLLLVACTVALACVALLRRPCRRWFGAESAFLLWGLPPLAMLGSQLPHAPVASSGAWADTAWVAVSGSAAWSGVRTVSVDWAGALTWIWVSGLVAGLMRAALAQARYCHRLRGAVPLAGVSLPWPVLRATTVDAGPALVGAWRPRIVVPADFETRYAGTEQSLVLAHEAMHARRRDGWCNLLAQLLASVLWFHPLAWWALAALRQDQELACDAAVLRERGCRRSYAQAMLKTPGAARALPFGCSWSSRHPLTERIAMLKMPTPGSARRRMGFIATAAIAVVFTGAVYATSAPMNTTATPRKDSDVGQYQLDIQLILSGDGTGAGHARSLDLAVCGAPGETSTVTTRGIELDAITRTVGDRRVSVDLAVRDQAGTRPAKSRLQGALDEPLRASGTIPGRDVQYTLRVTPRLGCPASATAAAVGERAITMKVRGTAAREVAEAIAAQAGLVLVNPEVFDERAIALDFQEVPAAAALQMVARTDGVRAVFDGARARFEPLP